MMLLDIEREDAHPGDLYGRHLTLEVADELSLSALLEGTLEPFIAKAPRARWICRARGRGGMRDVAELVTAGEPALRGARLLVHNESVRSFAGPDAGVLRIGCRHEFPG